MILLNAVDADVKSVNDMKEKDALSKVQASRASEDALSHLDTQEVISRTGLYYGHGPLPQAVMFGLCT